MQRKIDAVIQELSKAAIGKNSSIIIWGNRIISSIVFSKIDGSWTTAKSELITTISNSASLTEIICKVSNLLISEVNNSHASGYVANTFKNVSKSKSIYASIIEKFDMV